MNLISRTTRQKNNRTRRGHSQAPAAGAAGFNGQYPDCIQNLFNSDFIHTSFTGSLPLSQLETNKKAVFKLGQTHSCCFFPANKNTKQNEKTFKWQAFRSITVFNEHSCHPLSVWMLRCLLSMSWQAAKNLHNLK